MSPETDAQASVVDPTLKDDRAPNDRADDDRVDRHGGRRLSSRIAHFYPFTFAGTLLFLVAFVLFGRSVITKNAYGVILSLIALVALVILAVLARWQAQRLERADVSWDVGRPLFARLPNQAHDVSLDGPDPFLFFRIHVRMSGRFRISDRTELSLFRDVAGETARAIRLPLVFPLCGTARARGMFYIGDMFGLTRARFGGIRQLALTVQPAPLVGSEVPPIQATGGDRETSRTKQPDEERYYMREYVPGDRFRDINWKASSRLTELYTRTSPVTQEQTQLITIYFRHFVFDDARSTARRRAAHGGNSFGARLRKGYDRMARAVSGSTGETVEQIAHLNYAKSWLLAYLWTVKQDHPDFHFRIVTARGEAIVESESDIESLSRSIADLFMQDEPAFFGTASSASDSIPSESAADRKERDCTVFSTPYDVGLMGFVQARLAGTVSIYRTIRSPKADRRVAVRRPVTPLDQITGASGPAGSPAPEPVRNTIRFEAFKPGFFPVVSSFLPLRLPPLHDRNRTNPDVVSGGDVQLAERELSVDL